MYRAFGQRNESRVALQVAPAHSVRIAATMCEPEPSPIRMRNGLMGSWLSFAANALGWSPRKAGAAQQRPLPHREVAWGRECAPADEVAYRPDVRFTLSGQGTLWRGGLIGRREIPPTERRRHA